MAASRQGSLGAGRGEHLVRDEKEGGEVIEKLREVKRNESDG